MHFHVTLWVMKRPDGPVEVRFTAGGLLEMVHHLCTWGAAVKNVVPTALRQMMVERMEMGLKDHEPGATDPPRPVNFRPA